MRKQIGSTSPGLTGRYVGEEVLEGRSFTKIRSEGGQFMLAHLFILSFSPRYKRSSNKHLAWLHWYNLRLSRLLPSISGSDLKLPTTSNGSILRMSAIGVFSVLA